jgi:hypothetical protein
MERLCIHCYLCHRKFRSRGALNTNHASPAHDGDKFMCPKCHRTYKLVSGSVQHMEGEVCGITRFQPIDD